MPQSGIRNPRTVMAAAVCAPTLPPLSTHSLSACAKLPPRSACASCAHKQQQTPFAALCGSAISQRCRTLTDSRQINSSHISGNGRHKNSQGKYNSEGMKVCEKCMSTRTYAFIGFQIRGMDSQDTVPLRPPGGSRSAGTGTLAARTCPPRGRRWARQSRAPRRARARAGTPSPRPGAWGRRPARPAQLQHAVMHAGRPRE